MNDAELDVLRGECLRCRQCDIGGRMVDAKHLSNVFSSMNTKARIMAVGQNPGKDEVAQGIPFVGVSGQFFDEAIKSIGLSREDFYISNIVRCYTPDNRPPTLSELDNCRTFLDQEIAIVKPKVIVALGSLAFKQLTGMSGIMKHHGTQILSARYLLPVIPILHPSPLNTNHPDKRRMFMDGLLALKKYLDESE